MKRIPAFLYSVLYFNLPAQTSISKTMVFEGLTREYTIYIPAVYNSTQAVPLLFNLHGYTSDNTAQEYYGDFRPIADTANFIIIHPNGTFDMSGYRYWNSFDYSTVNDVGFLSAIIDSVSVTYNIDLSRVYSTGMSNGGFMSFDLACKLSNRIAAVASVTGSMAKTHMNACNAQHPVPIMQIHGTADGTVLYNGTSSVVSVPALIDHWVQFNNCSATPLITQVPDINTTDNCTAEHYLYQGGSSGSTVEHYKIINGGHTWPGAPVVIGTTNMDFSASREIWRFFSKYKLNELLSAALEHSSGKKIEIYPNPAFDNISIKFNGYIIENFEVHDILGKEKKVEGFSVINEEVKINTTGWAAGVYILTFREKGILHHKKLIKN